jgi:hypothetical protein
MNGIAKSHFLDRQFRDGEEKANGFHLGVLFTIHTRENPSNLYERTNAQIVSQKVYDFNKA